MRIVHDDGRCASTGICESIAPAVFRIDDDGALQVLEPEPGPGSADEVREAVARCPTSALRITEP